MLYQRPITVSWLAESLVFTNTTTLTYTNSLPITVSAEEMTGNTEAEFFYIDVAIVASEPGSAYYAAANEIVSVTDTNVLRVYNENPISGGLDRETNTELLTRVKDSIGARDLNTGSGFRATIRRDKIMCFFND